MTGLLWILSQRKLVTDRAPMCFGEWEIGRTGGIMVFWNEE